MVGGFNDVEEAVSVSAATSEAKQEASVMLLFQVLACGDETAGARDVGSHIALACLKDDPDTRTLGLTRCKVGPDPATLLLGETRTLSHGFMLSCDLAAGPTRVPVSGTLGRILRSDTPPSDDVTEREQGGESVPCVCACCAVFRWAVSGHDAPPLAGVGWA